MYCISCTYIYLTVILIWWFGNFFAIATKLVTTNTIFKKVLRKYLWQLYNPWPIHQTKLNVHRSSLIANLSCPATPTVYPWSNLHACIDIIDTHAHITIYTFHKVTATLPRFIENSQKFCTMEHFYQ